LALHHPERMFRKLPLIPNTPRVELSGIFSARRFHEEVEVQRGSERLDPQAVRCWDSCEGSLPAGGDQYGDVLPVEVEVRRDGGVGPETGQGLGIGERQAQADVCGAGAGQRGDEGPDRRKTVGPVQKREAVRFLVEVHARPLRRSCDCVGLSRSAWYAPPLDWTVRDAELIAALARLVEAAASRGFDKCCQALEKTHPQWNHKRIYRVYCQMKLNLRRAAKQRLPKRERVPLYVPEHPDVVWSADFMLDALACGRPFR